jgi:hypothetical protein
MSSDGEDLRGLATEQPRPELSELDLLSVEQLVSLMCTDVRRSRSPSTLWPEHSDAAGG